MAKERIINAAFMLQLFAFLAPPTLRGKEVQRCAQLISAGDLPVETAPNAWVNDGDDVSRFGIPGISEHSFPWTIPVKDQQAIDSIPYRSIDFRFCRDRCDCGPNRIVQDSAHPLYRLQKCDIVTFPIPTNGIKAGDSLGYGERNMHFVGKVRHCPIVGGIDSRNEDIVDNTMYPLRIG